MNQTATRRIEIIELVRGLAALAVALFHFANQLTSDLSVVITSWGWLGVDAFFIISGVVIPYSLHALNYRLGMFPRFMLVARHLKLQCPTLETAALNFSTTGPVAAFKRCALQRHSNTA